MPDVKELGRRVKAKYPEYNDLSDEEVGRRVRAKYPEYSDFTDTPAAPTQGVFKSFQTGVAGSLLRNVVETAADAYNRPLETLERAGRAGLEFISAFDPAGNAYEPTVKDQAARVAELKRRAEAERPETVRLMELGMREEEAKPRTRAGRIAFGTGKVLGEVAFPTNPESAVQNIATIPFGGAAAKTAGVAFKAGVNSVRRVFGKGAAQVIEAEAAPVAVARVPETPPVVGEAIPSPVPAVDPLQSAFAKLGTDNVEQIGAIFANANRRLRKKNFTPEQRASAVADYNALRKLTPEEQDALSQVLPARNFNPAEREISDIPLSERNAQLDANLREAEAFFGSEGRALQAAEDAAIMGDIGPGAMAGQFGGRAAAVAPRVEAEMALPSLSADMSTSGATAGVTGPRVGADLELTAAGGGAQPPRPPLFSPDDPWELPWMREPRPSPLFPQPPTEFTGVEPFQRPPQLQPLFDAAARSPWQDTALAYFRANLLTNPAGRAADLASTVVNQFADAAVRPIAAAVDVIVSKLTGSRSITGPSLSGTGRALGSVRQGLRDAREVLRTGRQVIDSGADDLLYGNEIRTGLGKVADVPINGLFRLLGALDAPFRRFAFTRNLSDRARVAAINEAKRGRIPSDQTITRARELIDHPDIIQAAVRDGERAVLSESNKISEAVASFLRDKPNARLAFGLLQPFVRIPLNAVAKAADFAGVGGVKALYKIARGLNRKRKGELFFSNLEEQRVFAQNVAAGSFGVAGFFLGMRLEEQGKLEGYFYTGRRDYPGRRPPTSIDIGGTRYDIGRLGGFIVAPLFIGATYNRLRKEDAGKANALLRSFGGLIQQAPALGYHGAPAKAGRILSADDMTGEMAKEAGNVASGFLPASGFLGATAKALDPMKKREAEGFTGPIMAKIPILREQLPATGNSALDAAVDRNSPLLVELQRLNIRVAELQRKKDEPDDAFNARVQQFGRNYTSYGQRLIQDPRFQAAPDDVKERALKRLNEKAKGLTRKQFAFPELELDPGLILDSVEK